MPVSSATLAASVAVTCVVSIGRKLGGSNLLVLVDSGICAEWACAVIMVGHDVAESACPYPERFAVRAKFHAPDGAWRLLAAACVLLFLPFVFENMGGLITLSLLSCRSPTAQLSS